MLITSFATLFLIILVTLTWHANARARELANRIVKHACEQHGVQWLDESTHLTCWRLRRDTMGSFGIWREFEFEFVDNYQREKGTVTLLHHAVIDLQLLTNKDESNTSPFQPANQVSNVIEFPTRSANDASLDTPKE